MFDLQLAFEVVSVLVVALALPGVVLAARGRTRAAPRALGVLSAVWGTTVAFVLSPIAGLVGWISSNDGHGIERDLGPFVVVLAVFGLVLGVAVVGIGVGIARGRAFSAARPVAFGWALLHVGASLVCFALAHDAMHGTWAWMLRHDTELWLFTILGLWLSLGGTAHAALLDHAARVGR